MKRILLYILFLLFLPLHFTTARDDASNIRRNPDYLIGEATAESMHKADSLAIDALACAIADETDFPYSLTVRQALLRTYTDDIARESSVLQSSGRKGETSFRYIRRDAVERVYAARREKVRRMSEIAGSSEDRLQMDVALRYWSWTSILLQSLPPVDATLISQSQGHCRAITEGMTASMSPRHAFGKNLIEIEFSYKGERVRGIDYRFYNGKTWSGVLSASDGLGAVEVERGTKIEDCLIRYEVSPSYMQHIFKEVKSVETALNTSQPQGKQPSQKSVTSESPARKIDLSLVKRKVLDVVSKDKFQGDSTSILPQISPVVFLEEYEEKVRLICKAVESRDFDSVDSLFTEEGRDIFRSLASYGKARVLSSDALQCYGLGDEVYCRSVPMTFSFPGNARTFLERLVFCFNPQGLVSNVSFALSSQTVREVLSQEQWSEEARLILVTFLENYKTAYALKRLDYIDSIFDEDALIITGHVLKDTGRRGEFSESPYVELTRRSKREYIDRLAKVFASQEFVNIAFTDCRVMKLGKGEQLYGIQLRQEYWSSSYSDTGYLFLLVDLTDYASPVIHVRTWQEAPDEKYGIIGPWNF